MGLQRKYRRTSSENSSEFSCGVSSGKTERGDMSVETLVGFILILIVGIVMLMIITGNYKNMIGWLNF